MARCGCSSTACTCVVTGAGLATSSGTGTPNNPYVISVTCESVRTCFSAGPGVTIVDGVISAPGSAVVADSPCIDLSGTGTLADPIVATPIIADEPNGLSCTPTGLAVAPSTDPGNTLSIGTDGNLFTPPGGLPTLGCGLEFSGAGELQVNTEAWPFPCDPETNGSPVSCGTDGVLRGLPRGEIAYQDITFDVDTPRVIAAGDDFTTLPATVNITNPSTCFAAWRQAEMEGQVQVVLPPGGRFGVVMSLGNDQTINYENTGTTAQTFSVQTTKVIGTNPLALAPGANVVSNATLRIINPGGVAITVQRYQISNRQTVIAI